MLKGFGDLQSDLTAKAQALVGQLLQARNTLNGLTSNADPNIVNQANVLLATQTDLENQLTTLMALLNSGASLGIADYANATVFMVKAQAQIDAVNALSQGQAAPMSLFEEVGLGAGGLILIGLLLYFGTRK